MVFIPPSSILEKTEAAIRGNAEAIGLVFKYFQPQLQAYALILCGNTPLAQDVLQETLINAYTHLNSLRNPYLFYPWIKKILFNNALRMRQKERARPELKFALREEWYIQQSIDTHFEQSANQQRLYGALSRLSSELCSCVMLRYFSEHNSYEDIALLLDIPVGTVRSRLSAAKEKLGALYSRLDDAGDEALNYAQNWTNYYRKLWGALYDDHQVRMEFFNHLLPQLNIRFTSGKTGQGRGILEQEINEDLQLESPFLLQNVVSSGNISIIEVMNHNTPDYPDRCAPLTTFVTFRLKDKIEKLYVFDSTRPKLPV